MCYGARSGALRAPDLANTPGLLLESSWKHPGSSWRRLKCCKIAPNIVPKWFQKGSWNPLGDILALVCLLVPLLWPPESLLKRSGEPFGQLWGALGGVWGSSGALLETSGRTLPKPSFCRWNSMVFNVSRGAPERLERLLEACLALLELS